MTHKEVRDGKVDGFVGWCPECGPVKGIDEDGCCTSCGNFAYGPGSRKALRLLRAVRAARKGSK